MKIPVYKPKLSLNASKYVNDCLESNWISSKGKYLDKFEKKFSNYLGTENATTVSNGTTALHLALRVLGIGPGDEVIVPTLTYIASVNSIAYVGAKPVFVDSETETWNLDTSLIEKNISKKTKAIMAVHLYGNPCNMNVLQRLCKKYNLFLIEDVAEALGSTYKNEFLGTFGDVSTFSFFGNKTITTGEGGMVVSKDKSIIDKVKYLKNQARISSPSKEYWHEDIGYNYRMTNICAAIGLSQIEEINSILTKKKRLLLWYKSLLSECPLIFQLSSKNSESSVWMVSVLTENQETRSNLRFFLEKKEIETRSLFNPIHKMPVFYSTKSFPVSEDISIRGLNLPSYPSLKKREVFKICELIKIFFKT